MIKLGKLARTRFAIMAVLAGVAGTAQVFLVQPVYARDHDLDRSHDRWDKGDKKDRPDKGNISDRRDM